MPPIAPPPRHADVMLDYESSDESSYNSSVCAMEETPLVSHGSRKVFRTANSRSSRNAGDTYPMMLSTQYSAIVEETPSREDHSLTTSYNEDDDDDDDRSIASLDSISSVVTMTSYVAENFRESLLLPFTDELGSMENVASGLAALAVVGAVVGLVMPKNPALQDGQLWEPYYRYLSSVIGYVYFILWSVCFYPQVLLNYRRKSTRGLSNDFAILNFMGWSFYSAYLASMYFDADIRHMYAERFASESSTVQSNDVAFALHAAVLSFVYLVQIVWYRWQGSNQKDWSFPLKPQTWVLVLGMGLPTLVMPALIHWRFLSYSRWLDYFYTLSFFKICCTLTKYSKQVMLNYHRQSTQGWNIWYNFLECSGGSLSLLQIVLDSIAMNEMAGITGNMAKFALGFATIFFDAIFFTQHYVWYSHSAEDVEVSKARHVRTTSRLEILIHDIDDDFQLSCTSNDQTDYSLQSNSLCSDGDV